jgi:D-xylose transport system substrate-binding protein
MKAKGTYKGGTVAELWGGQTDQNAFWFKSGNDKVLNPLFKSGAIKKGPQQFVPDWDANNAATIFSQMLVKTNNNIQGAIAANDNTAGAVIADLKAKHLGPPPRPGRGGRCPEHHLRLAVGHVQVKPDEANAAGRVALTAASSRTERPAETQASGADLMPVIGSSLNLHSGLFSDDSKKSDAPHVWRFC